MSDRTIRNREQSTADQLSSLGGPDPSRGDSFAGVTVSLGSYPTAAQRVYAVQPIDVGGTESEGTAFTTTNVGGPIFAANVGSAVPAAGTRVRVDPAGGRYTIAYYGG